VTSTTHRSMATGGWERSGLSVISRMAAIALALVCCLALAGRASATPPPPIGGVTQLSGITGCVTIVGGGATCTPARGVDGASSAILSPDGRNLYVDSYRLSAQEGLAVFSRDPSTGGLTQLAGSAGCITADGASAAGPGTCAAARGYGVGDGRDLVFTSDGAWAYLVNQRTDPADPAAAIVLFRRDLSTGALTQIPGAGGCISVDGSSQAGAGTCQTLPTLAHPSGISISADDRFVYVTDYGNPSRVHVLSRSLTTGALAEVQCLSDAPAPTGCAAARVIGNAKSLVLSRDGLHAYSADSTGISVLDRDPQTGMLTQPAGTAGCVSETGNDNTGASTCAVARVVGGAYALDLSPDGRTVYVGSARDHGLALLRVASDGGLTQLPDVSGCLTLTGDDNRGNPTCTPARGLSAPFGVAISPDGRTLYVIADNDRPVDGLAIFSLDPATGAATQLPGPAGCITVDGTSNGVPGLCAAAGAALKGAYDPVVSPDGHSLYVPGYGGQMLSVYHRETGPVCRATRVTTPFQTAAPATLSCSDPDGDQFTPSIESNPAHGVLSPFDQAAGVVTYFPTAGYAGLDSFTFSASDGTNTSAPATTTLSVSPAAPTTPAGGVTAPGNGASTRAGATRPRIAQLRQSHPRWSQSRTSRHGVPVGTTFSFLLNERAQVALQFLAREPGRRVAGRCTAPSPRNRAHAACTHTVTRGMLRVTGHTGRNAVAFAGRFAEGKPLPPGTYTVSVTASTGGRRSPAQTLAFTVLR
jgi:sugar lactone lactonase YvrE